jgi:hypothetical protein
MAKIKKRMPKDVNKLAARVVELATGQKNDTQRQQKKAIRP